MTFNVMRTGDTCVGGRVPVQSGEIPSLSPTEIAAQDKVLDEAMFVSAVVFISGAIGVVLLIVRFERRK